MKPLKSRRERTSCLRISGDALRSLRKWCVRAPFRHAWAALHLHAPREQFFMIGWCAWHTAVELNAHMHVL
eukprot:2628011-Prymnesium_polylepis.1